MRKKVPMVLAQLAQIKRGWALSVVLIFAILVTLLPSAAIASSLNNGYDGVYYRVQRGDTLSEIAAWHGTTVHALMQANGIHNPNHIYVGQKLYIPSRHGGYGDKHDDGHDGGYGGPQCAFYHTVQYGQTLAAIANYYGVNIHTLAQVNAIYNWNHVYSGQRLCIPGGYQPPPPHPPKPHPQPPKPHPQPPTSTCTYVVQPGDTLAKIAFWYGTTVHALVQLNNLYNVNQLYVGQVLYVPGQNCPGQKPPDPKPVPVDAWEGVYFNNKYLQGGPALTRQDGSINFDWAGGGPGNGVGNDQFSVAWSRTAYFQSGTYRFYATVDDGIRVYVDGHLLIDSWREQPATNYFGDIYLGEGTHSLRVEYYEEGGGALVRVWWSKL